MKYLLLLGLLLATRLALAAPTAALAWTTPTQHVDGTPVTGAMTYATFQGPQGSTLVQTNTGLTVNTLSVTTGLTPGTVQCFAVTATEAGNTAGSSAPSNQGCVTVPLPPPSPPLAPTLTVTLH